MGQVSYKRTKAACYLGYVTQAIAINLLPLLYLTFQQDFGVSLSQLGFLVTILFVIQIVVDLLAARYGKNLSYRWGSVISFALAALGLVAMCVLPLVMDPYVGILAAALVLSIGGGLIEVLISPMIDAIPEEGKTGEMSLLHSFYCWGVVAVILFSTLYFSLVGMEHWRLLVLLWAVVPTVTAVLFVFVPVPPKPEEFASSDQGGSVMLRNGWFWLLMALMLFSGATELAPAQWASFFAERGLNIPKAVGDLLGPCAFAACQGLSRVVFAPLTRRYDPRRLLALHAAGCVVSYALIVLSPWSFVSLLGFCLCGWCVGPMWPGVLSLSSQRFPNGGTALFALLALCGDIGCSLAPITVGAVSDRLGMGVPISVAMRGGFAVCMLFPILLMVGLLMLRKSRSER